MAKRKDPILHQILKNNPKIDVGGLTKGLDSIRILRKLREQGINDGPNYNLGSPFCRPVPEHEDLSGAKPPVILRNLL